MAPALQQLWSFQPPRAASLEEQKTLELSPMHLPPRHCPRLGGIPCVCPSPLQDPTSRNGAEIPEMGQIPLLCPVPEQVVLVAEWGSGMAGREPWGWHRQGHGHSFAHPSCPGWGRGLHSQSCVGHCEGQCCKQEGLWSVLGTEIQGPRGSWLMAVLRLCHQRPQGQGDTGTGNTASPGPNTSIPLSACGPDRCWLITNKHLFVYW